MRFEAGTLVGQPVSTRSGVVRGTLSLGGARMVVNLLNMLGVVVLARLLMPADFGIVAISTTMLTIVASFTELSLQPALVHASDPDRDHVDTVWTMMLLRASAIFLLFVLAAWPLSLVYGDARLLPVFLVTGLTGALYDFSNPKIALATKYMDFKPAMKFQIYQKLFGLVISTVLAVLLRNYWALIIGNAAGAVITALLSYRLVPYRPRWHLSRASEIWGYSRWLSFNQICETLNWRYDQLAISFVVPKAQLGVYAMADNLSVIPTRELTNPMTGALFAGMTASRDKPDGLRRSFLRSQSLMTLVTAPLALGLALVADPAVQLILGERWQDCAIFVRIFAICYMLDTFTSSVRPAAMAAGQTRLIFLRQLIVLAIRVPVITVGLVFGGIVGVAVARLCASVVEFIVGSIVACRLVGLSLWELLRIHGPTVVGLAAMAAALAPLGHDNSFGHGLPLAIRLAGQVLAGGLAYGFAILLVWLVLRRPAGAVSELFEIAYNLLSRRSLGRSGT